MTAEEIVLQALKPCPFCGAGEYRVTESHLPPRMSGPGALISVQLLHWCAKIPGCIHALTEVRGREHLEVIEQWNTRVNKP